MPTPQDIQSQSRFFENLLEHRFLFDLQRELVLHDHPRFLNVLKSEVDAFGFDLVLSTANPSRTIHAQMKTRSGNPPMTYYEISDALWSLPEACVIWMTYDLKKLEPKDNGYYLLGLPMPPISGFASSSRSGFRKVKMQYANHPKLSLQDLAQILFP